MKVIYVGDFKATHSSENYVAYGLEQLGVEVIKFQENERRNLHELVDDFKKENPDFVLFCKNRIFGNGNILLHELKKAGIKTVTWMFDLYVNLPPEMMANRSLSDIAFKSDIVCTSDGGHETLFEKLKINHKLLRQGIHEPDAHYGVKVQCPEIIFVGTNSYPARGKLLSTLRRKYGDNFGHYGTRAHFPEVRGKDLNNLLTSAKIVVGDSVPSYNYWSNRVYEVLGRGGFLIHPRVDGLEKEFKYFEHLIPFDYGNFDQLFEIIDYYLTHDEEREKIRRAGHEFVKANYTYTKRCKQLLELVK